MAQFEDMMQDFGGLDPMDAPVPGESLTANPEVRAAYEKPPVQTELEPAMEDLFMRLTEKESMDQVINLMRADIPVEDIAQVVLFGGFREGQFNPDLMMLMIEPTIYLLLWIADYAGVEAVLYPEGDVEDADEDLVADTEVEDAPVPEGISPDLLSRIRETVGSEEE